MKLKTTLPSYNQQLFKLTAIIVTDHQNVKKHNQTIFQLSECIKSQVLSEYQDTRIWLKSNKVDVQKELHQSRS